MELLEYQQKAAEFAIYPQSYVGQGFSYCSLGLNGEAGEVAEHAKKILRDDMGNITAQRKKLVKKELGDVLWYLALCCEELGTTLEDVAIENLQKLNKRKKEGKIQGSGSSR